MRNITVSVPDDVYRRARIYAAQTGTSVSRLVVDFLQSADGLHLEYDEAAEKREQIAARITGFRAAERLPRDEIHDRDALR